MKRIFALLLCCALLAGCGSPSSGSVSAAAGMDSASSEPAEASSTVQEEVPADPVWPLTGLPREGEALRPIAVMVNNHPGVAVQWGVADADLVMEGLTEGKTTNLCLWFSSLDRIAKVGPIAEGKDLFWQFGIAENAILCQKGMNAYAENLLNCYTYQPIDALYVGVNSFDYDGSLAYGTPDEYRWYTRGSSIGNSLGSYGIAAAGAAGPLFHFGAASGGTAGAAAVVIGYSGQSSSTLRYDAAAGQWLLYRAGGAPQADGETGVQAAFTNVVLLQCAAGVKDDRYTREYDLAGGTGWYLTGDAWQPITWAKGAVTDPLKLYAADGTELAVNPGRTYLGLYGIAGQTVTIQDAAGTALQSETVAAAAAEPTAEPPVQPTVEPGLQLPGSGPGDGAILPVEPTPPPVPMGDSAAVQG